MRKSQLMTYTIVLLLTGVVAAEKGPYNLKDCVEMALRNNPAIHAAKWNQDSTTLKRRAAVSTFLPEFKAEYSHTWLDEQPTIAIPGLEGMTIPGSTQDVTIDLSSIGYPPITVPIDIPGMQTPPTGPYNIPAGEDEIENITVTVTQPIFAGGAIWTGYKLVKLQEESAKLQTVDVIGEIVYQTELLFYTVLKTREYVRVAEKAVEMGEALRKRTQDFYDVGLIAKNQLLEAEVNLAQMRQNLTVARTSHDLALTSLAVMIGNEDDYNPLIEGELEITSFEKTIEECLKDGLRDRPDIRMARKHVEMANLAIKLEQSGWTPKVALIGTYQHETGGLSSDEDILSLTLGAQWTFWEWGKKYYNLKSTKSMAQAASHNLRMTRDRAILEIKQAYIKIQQAKVSIFTAQTALQSAEENLRVVQLRFDQQLDTSFDVLKAQTLLTQAETNLVSAKADYITARAELDRAMGVVTPSEPEKTAGETVTNEESVASPEAVIEDAGATAEETIDDSASDTATPEETIDNTTEDVDNDDDYIGPETDDEGEVAPPDGEEQPTGPDEYDEGNSGTDGDVEDDYGFDDDYNFGDD